MMIDGLSVPREVGNGFTHCVPIAHPLMPEGELAVHQGAQVQASDGNIGQLDKFLLAPITEQIDYVALHERHSWRQQALIYPPCRSIGSKTTRPI